MDALLDVKILLVTRRRAELPLHRPGSRVGPSPRRQGPRPLPPSFLQASLLLRIHSITTVKAPVGRSFPGFSEHDVLSGQR